MQKIILLPKIIHFGEKNSKKLKKPLHDRYDQIRLQVMIKSWYQKAVNNDLQSILYPLQLLLQHIRPVLKLHQIYSEPSVHRLV